MTLADALERAIAEHGAAPACTLARELRRCYADVLAALDGDARFEHVGRRKGSRWSLAPSRNGRHPASRSTEELAGLLNRSPAWTEALLEESERGGVVERVNGGWRLSTAGELRYGRALRALTMPRDAL